MVAARKSLAPAPPPGQGGPVVHGTKRLQDWLMHYWDKLHLPLTELNRLAITQDRAEYMRWTAKRLNTMALGCYCYLPAPRTSHSRHTAGHRHLIFVEPDMQPQSIEVTVAHELIHLADRVQGTPRKHHHHGYDSIAADEAAVTGYGLEELRRLLHQESLHREQVRRQRRPIRYLYECPHCGKEYPRTRRYSHNVSCSSCDKSYNPNYCLRLRA